METACLTQSAVPLTPALWARCTSSNSIMPYRNLQIMLNKGTAHQILWTHTLSVKQQSLFYLCPCGAGYTDSVHGHCCSRANKRICCSFI